MMSLYKKLSLQVLTGLVITLNLNACNTATEPTENKVDNSGLPAENVLNVVTRHSETSYFNGKEGADGFEYQLIQQFAQSHHYQLKLIIANTEAEIYQALDHGLADIAMIGHPLSINKQEEYQRSQPLMDVTTQLIYRHGSGRPQAFDDLLGKKLLVQDTLQYREKYNFLKRQYQELDWTFTQKNTNELLTLVNQGKIDYTLVDSHVYTNKSSLYPKTRVAFDLYYPEPISWIIGKHTDKKTLHAVDDFLDNAKEHGLLNQLHERFYGHSDDVNPRGSMVFFRRVNTRLPNYQDLIEDIASQYHVDWRLLAAIAYQESHWNPHARSPTGVRGMMMLTLGTAKDMGIENRLDVSQSLRGGAKYLKQMLRRLPKDIQEPDRTWFALAAYNVGLGHVLDARRITEFHGGNQNRWSDVKLRLPLLEQKQWYRYTRYGHARGSEPVSYVQHIRHFSDLLEWRFPTHIEQKQQTQTASGISIKNINPQMLKEAKNKQSQPIKISEPKLSQSLLSLFRG